MEAKHTVVHIHTYIKKERKERKRHDEKSERTKVKGRLAVSKVSCWKRTNVIRGRKMGENSVDEIESVRVGWEGGESRYRGCSKCSPSFDRLPAWSMRLRVYDNH